MAFGLFFFFPQLKLSAGPGLSPVLSNRDRVLVGTLYEWCSVRTLLYEYADHTWFLVGTSIICFIPVKQFYVKTPVFCSLILVGILPLTSIGADNATLWVLQPITPKIFLLHPRWYSRMKKAQWKKKRENAILQINCLPNLKWAQRKGTNTKTSFESV